MGRFRYAYNSFSYYGEEIGRSIERVAAFGYDAIELVGEPEQYDAARVRKLAADAGIAVSSISSMYTAERDLCHPDQRMRRKAVDYVRAVADLAAAAGGGLAILKTGDRVSVDLNKGQANILISPEEIARRRADLNAHGGFPIPKSQTPWQEIQRAMVDQFDQGMVLKPAIKYHDVAHTMGIPRDNH